MTHGILCHNSLNDGRIYQYTNRSKMDKKPAERTTSSMERTQTVMIGHAPDVAAGCMYTVSMR